VPDSDRRLLPLLIVLALLGVADGLYLTIVHLDYEVGRAGLSTVCHAFSATGCTVTAGRFGDFGGIPVATLGMGGALATTVLAMLAWIRRARWEDPFRSGALVLAVISALASVTMAVLSAIEGAWCPFCVLWYALNFGQAAVAWACRDRHLGVRDALDDLLGMPALVAAAVFAATIATGTWGYRVRHDQLEQERDAVFIPMIVEELRQQTPEHFELTDAPSKGPADAEVTIVEFGDFECPFCRKLWLGVEHYAASGQRTVRVQFAHFPLDSACNRHVEKMHPMACNAAVAGECARRQAKFFELGEVMFAHQDALGREQLREHAATAGLDVAVFDKCMVDPSALEHVKQDIARAIELGIEATPTFFVNGYRVTGALPPQVLAGVIEGLLALPDQSAQ
jgi:protein-disulfide isomerase/uncharacterized membrane protein